MVTTDRLTCPKPALLTVLDFSVLTFLSLSHSLTSAGGGATANNGTAESEPESSNGGGVTPVLGPEATPRGRVGHGHVKSASISAGSGNSQSTTANREAAASASAAERDSQRFK